MIKVNVLLKNISWKKQIKNPAVYVGNKVRLLNKKNKFYKKNILSFTLLLSGPHYIKKLNKKFRNKNKATDVLSFPSYSKKDLKNLIKKEKKIYLGDIILNLNKIKNKNNINKFKDEFNYLWIHGLVHLFGYKHKLNKDFKKMRKIEKNYFQYIST